MSRERSPGVKLVLVGLVALVLIVPLVMVYALVYDRESQSQTAQQSITQGWGGAQMVTGPVMVIPWMQQVTTNETVDGQVISRTSSQRRELFLSPTSQSIETQVDPQRRGYAIYESIVYDGSVSGDAVFDMPDDLDRLGIEPEQLMMDQLELRFGVSDPAGLTDSSNVSANGEQLQLQPGNGPAVTNGAGFSAYAQWAGDEPLAVSWDYGIRGSQSISMIPRGGETEWSVRSTWPHPSFTGTPPNEREATAEGFTAEYSGITNLALSQRLANLEDFEPPALEYRDSFSSPVARASDNNGMATIGLVDPVDLYSQVDRAVKYGFLFIGFTFATFLMFDIVGGARVAAAEYLLTGAGLILFFVMLLAFAEVWGFGRAYIIAAAAVIGLLTTYSAAVLGTWRRAGFIGAMLAGLYALLFVLLNMETYALVIGSLLLFAALAGVMFMTRKVDWSAMGRSNNGDIEGEGYA